MLYEFLPILGVPLCTTASMSMSLLIIYTIFFCFTFALRVSYMQVHRKVFSDAQGITLVRIDPDSLQVPCPQQRMEFQCQIMVSSTALTWTLPDGSFLEFDRVSDFGIAINSSDDIYSAILTSRTDDNDPSTSTRFFFTSTLVVMQPMNRSTLTCAGGSGADPVEESTSIILSG